METKTASTVLADVQPLFVSNSVQILPPIVTWPVWKANRGLITRQKGGLNGYVGLSEVSR